jgi:ubiquinone/menaquinone biosynthesis C-methylase UbiE
LWGEHRSRYRFAAGFIKTGDLVLDVACGAGFGLRMLENAGARVIGLDYNAATLQTIPSTRLVRGDATRLPITSGAIDHVTSMETIEHVSDAKALVAEARRVLKPGGYFILSTPNRAFGPPQRHTANPYHVREFTANELRQLVCEHFRSVELFGQRPSPDYRFVPYLLYRPDYTPRALLWKLMLRLPYRMRDVLSRAVSGRPFYPGEADYHFHPEETEGVHALVVVAK